MKSKPMKKPTPDLDPLQVKIALLMRGESLLSWSRRNGFEQSTVWRCLHEGYRGRRSAAIASRIQADLLQQTGGK